MKTNTDLKSSNHQLLISVLKFVFVSIGSNPQSYPIILRKMGSTTVPTTSRFYESFTYDILFHHFLRSLSSIHNSARSFVRERDQGYPKMQ